MPTTTLEELIPISYIPGVCPDTDCTNAATTHFTAADKIRFVKGRPQKIGGWDAVTMNGASISGCVRTVFSSQLSDKIQTLLGSNEALYGLVGSSLENITPFQTSTTPAGNSLDTHYDTLSSDPLRTYNTSRTVSVTDPNPEYYEIGDDYTLSGATATGGVPAGDLNKTHKVITVGSNTINIRVDTAATSSTTGGGASVVRSSGLLTVNSTAHGQEDGDRVDVDNAVAVGGITAVQINTQHVIRNITANSFDIMTAGTSTSSVSAGGGASTTYYKQVAAGLCDETGGQGYGMSYYGVGRYGTALESANARRLPRVYHMDAFGNNIVLTPGDGGGVYSWSGLLTTAPTVVTNAPTEVNYLFVSDNILVTFGAGGTRNKIKTSDQGNITTWTASSTNKVFEDDIEGAGRLLSHVSLNGTNLIFTNNQCYTFRFIDLPLVWQIKFKDNIGIIAPMARVVVKGVAYWMGQNNFYEWRGGNVEVSKSNSGDESTILRYVFDDINRGQVYKCFAWYNKQFDEIWFHYPSADSTEVNRIARYHVTAKHWTPDTMDRTAAEYPTNASQLPRLVDSLGNFYRHEVGHDDGGTAMSFSLTFPLRRYATSNVLSTTLVPDSIQTTDTDITVVAKTKSYPQSPTFKDTQTVTVTPTTEFVPIGIEGRYLTYTVSGSALGQKWVMGSWLDGVQASSGAE